MLTERKKAFADAVLGGMSQKEAAIASGLSENTAKQAGCRMAKDIDVLAYLKKQRKAGPMGLTAPDGQKVLGAPAGWPFGKAVEPPVAPPTAPPEPGKVLTAREYLSNLVNDIDKDDRTRLEAAKKLIEYEEAKPAPQGKKAGKQDVAKKLVSKFTPSAPPKLVAAGGKKI